MEISSIQKMQGRLSDIRQRVHSLETKLSQTGDTSKIQQQSETLITQANVHSSNKINPAEILSNAGNRQNTQSISFTSQLEKMILSESKKAQINPELVKAIVHAESNGNPQAVSKAGAIGLMQLMPKTAKSLGVNAHNPRENLRGGIQYLKNMAKRYGDLDKTLAAYNAGPGNVDKYNSVPPFKETQDYIKKIRKQLIDVNG